MREEISEFIKIIAKSVSINKAKKEIKFLIFDLIHSTLDLFKP